MFFICHYYWKPSCFTEWNQSLNMSLIEISKFTCVVAWCWTLENDRRKIIKRTSLIWLGRFDVRNSTSSCQWESALFFLDKMNFRRKLIFLFFHFLFFLLLFIAFILKFNGSISTFIVSDKWYFIRIMFLQFWIIWINNSFHILFTFGVICISLKKTLVDRNQNFLIFCRDNFNFMRELSIKIVLRWRS